MTLRPVLSWQRRWVWDRRERVKRGLSGARPDQTVCTVKGGPACRRALLRSLACIHSHKAVGAATEDGGESTRGVPCAKGPSLASGSLERAQSGWLSGDNPVMGEVSARPSEMLTHSATWGRLLRGMAETCCLLGACACAVQADAKSYPLANKRAARQRRLYHAALKPAARTLRSTGRSGPKVQVLRHGSFRQRKALEPEGASTEAVVVEVRIEGKSASAYGPSFDRLQRGPASQELEQEVGDRIRWRDGPASLPPALVILSDEGSEVVARLRFEGCGTGSAGSAGCPRRSKQQTPTWQANPPASGIPSRTLPRGAIQ